MDTGELKIEVVMEIAAEIAAEVATEVAAEVLVEVSGGLGYRSQIWLVTEVAVEVV